MTVKENHTILSRATIRAITITALVAVAAVFSTQNTGVAFGSCPYTPSPGDQADLWLDMNGEDTYFTDAEWPGLEVKTFSLKGPFRGEVNIRTYTGWGLTTSTTSSEISCTTAQSYTAIKNSESMPIYLKRCNWGDNTSLQFGITHERKCILNAGQSHIYPMIITESDMEGTPLTYTTGGEDGAGNRRQEGAVTENDEGNRRQEGTVTENDEETSTCTNQSDPLRPEEDTSTRGVWTGPNISQSEQISDASRIHSDGIAMMRRIWDNKASADEAQQTADTLWRMSHEFRKFPVTFPVRNTNRSMLIGNILRYWVTEAGLQPSEAARTAGVPWSIFVDRLGNKLSPAEARERYGGLDGRHITVWMNENNVRWFLSDPGGLNEVLVGPAKHYDDGIGNASFRDKDGNNLTTEDAMFAYGLPRFDESWEDYAAKHELTILVNLDEQHGVTSNRECTTETGGNNSNNGNNSNGGQNGDQQSTTESNYVRPHETTRTIRQATTEELLAAAYAGTVYTLGDETISSSIQSYFEAFLNGDVSEFWRITNVYNNQVLVVLPDGQAALMMLTDFSKAVVHDVWPRGVAHAYSLNDRLPKGPTRITLVLRAMAENRWDEVHRYSTTDDVLVSVKSQDGSDRITITLGEWVAQKVAEHLNEQDETSEPRRLTIASDPPHPLGGEPSTITIDSHCENVELYRNGLLLDTGPIGWRDYTETWHHHIRHQYQAKEQCTDDGVEMLATMDVVWRAIDEIPEEGVVEISMNPPKAAPGETIRMDWYIVGPTVEYIDCDRPAETATGGGTQGTMEWTPNEPATVYCVIRTNRQREGPNGPYTYVHDETRTATWE